MSNIDDLFGPDTAPTQSRSIDDLLGPDSTERSSAPAAPERDFLQRNWEDPLARGANQVVTSGLLSAGDYTGAARAVGAGKALPQDDAMEAAMKAYVDNGGDITAVDDALAAGGIAAAWRVLIQSTPQMAAQMPAQWAGAKGGAVVGGAAGSVVPGVGTAAGAAAGGLAGASGATYAMSSEMEYQGRALEIYAEHGYDTTDPAQLEAATKDPAVQKDLEEKALPYARVVGGFDAASMGLAGGPAKVVTSIGKNIAKQQALRAAARAPQAAVAVAVPKIPLALAQAGSEALAQGALGAGGSIGGQIAAGEDVNYLDAAYEAVSELPGAGPEAFINHRTLAGAEAKGKAAEAASAAAAAAAAEAGVEPAASTRVSGVPDAADVASNPYGTTTPPPSDGAPPPADPATRVEAARQAEAQAGGDDMEQALAGATELGSALRDNPPPAPEVDLLGPTEDAIKQADRIKKVRERLGLDEGRFDAGLRSGEAAPVPGDTNLRRGGEPLGEGRARAEALRQRAGLDPLGDPIVEGEVVGPEGQAALAPPAGPADFYADRTGGTSSELDPARPALTQGDGTIYEPATGPDQIRTPSAPRNDAMEGEFPAGPAPGTVGETLSNKRSGAPKGAAPTTSGRAPSVSLGGRDIPVTQGIWEQRAGDHLVEVKTDAFEAGYKGDSGYVGPKGQGGIAGRYDRFEEFSKTASSIEAPDVGVNQSGAVVFGNGRHRYASMRDNGAKSVWVSMDSESREHARAAGMLVEPTVGEKLSNKKAAPSTPEFKQFFGESKVTDEAGAPRRLYTGTSKDVDFKSFKMPKNGTWFTEDPEGASQYAMSNDSQDKKHDPKPGNYWNFSDVNSASRVMPVYANISNPKVYEDPKEFNDLIYQAGRENYKKGQGIVFENLRAQGYDGIRLGKSDGKAVWVAIKDATQIKSATGNSGAYDPKNKDIAKNERADAAAPRGPAPTIGARLAETAAGGKKVDSLQMVAQRGERRRIKTSTNTAAEEAAIEKYSEETGVSVAEITAAVDKYKRAHPKSAGWAQPVYSRTVLDDKGKAKHEYVKIPYGFSDAADGTALTPGSKEYKAQVTKVAKGLTEEVRKILRRKGAGDENAKNILEQAGWYKAMRSRLRHEFGGLGDLFADLLGATSPKTPVRTNWDSAVEVVRRASRGDYDALMPQWEAWSDNIEALEVDLRAWFSDQEAQNETAAAGLAERRTRAEEAQATARREYEAARKAEEPSRSLTTSKKGGVTTPGIRDDAAWKSIGKAELAALDQEKRGHTKDAIKDHPVYQAKIGALREARKLPEHLNPRKEAGPKFGINGGNVVRAMVDLWRTVRNADTDIGRGPTAPKAITFSGNLIGFRERATIDVWAGRLLQRMAGLLRVPSACENGVTGALLEDGTTTLQYGFGQDAFTEAVKRIRADAELNGDKTLAAINDDDLQAVVWFIEKEIWTELDSTSVAGEGGSFELEASLAGTNQRKALTEFRRKLDSKRSSPAEKAAAKAALAELERTVDRFVGGISMQTEASVPTDPEMAAFGERVRKAAYLADDGNTVIAAKSVSTEGVYGDPERSLDLELTTREGYDPTPLWKQMVTEARDANQDATHLSRVLRAEEEANFDPLIHRPGIEVYFREALSGAKLQKILDDLAAKGVQGLTVVVDGRRMPAALRGEMPAAVGVRIQYVPEYLQRFGMEDFSGLDDAAMAARVEAKAEEYADMADEVLATVDGVSFAGQFWYETQVAFSHQYEEIINGGEQSERAAQEDGGPARGQEWAGQPIRAGVENANRRGGETASGEPGRDVLDGDPVEGAGERIANRPGARQEADGRGRPSYGKARDGSVKVTGVHFSRKQQTELDSKYYGSGMRGAERGRLGNADPRLQQRTYFYVQEDGKPVKPEGAVGGEAHSVTLNNVYDAKADPLKLWVSGDANASELNILEAGFDGYLVRGAWDGMGVVALLGQHNVPVQYEGTSYAVKDRVFMDSMSDLELIVPTALGDVPTEADVAEYEELFDTYGTRGLTVFKNRYSDGSSSTYSTPGDEVKQTLANVVEHLANNGLDLRNIPSIHDIVVGEDIDARAEFDITQHFLAVSREVLDQADSSNPEHIVNVAFLVAHEASHAVDSWAGGGPLASQSSPDFEFDINPGRSLTNVGPVMEEAIAAYYSDDATLNFLSYPMNELEELMRDVQSGGTPTAREIANVKVELFAQLGAFFYTNPGMMAEKMPVAFKFMQEVHDAQQKDLGRPGAPRTGAARQDPKALRAAIRPGVIPSGTDTIGQPLTDQSRGVFEKRRSAAPVGVSRAAPRSVGERLRDRSRVGEGKAKGLTGTASFQKWFGDSKVVDANGEPKVMYHGSYDSFGEFSKTSDVGFHFASSDVANTRLDRAASERKLRGGARVEGRNIQPVYLSIENPVMLERDPGKWDPSYLGLDLVQAGAISREQRDEIEERMWSRSRGEGAPSVKENQKLALAELKAALESAGHDGIVYRNLYEGTGKGRRDRRENPQNDTWVAFRPGQIKSAIGNNGKFDSSNPDITKNRKADPAARGAPPRSAAFQKWFGDSKVVDARGEPLVVHHGTGAKFNTFDMTKGLDGAHFFTANESHAASFGSPRAFFVRIENPMVISQDDLDGAWDAEHLVDGLEPEDVDTDKLPRDYVGDFVEKAKAAGHDGLIVENMGDRDIQADMYLPFKPEQIKSATDNNGKFDRSNPDITKNRKADPAARGPAPTTVGERLANRRGAPPPANPQAQVAGQRANVNAIGANNRGPSAPVRKSARQRLIDAVDLSNPLKSLPKMEKYLTIRGLTLGHVARINKQVRGIYDVFRKANPAQALEVYTYLTERNAPATGITDLALRDNAIKMKQAFLASGNELVRLGLLDPDAFRSLEGAYLPRMYLSHLLDDEDVFAMSSGQKPSDLSYLKHRQHISEQTKLILGEIRDPAFLASQGFGHQMRDIAMLQWLEEVSKDEDWVLQQSLVDWDGKRVTPYWLKNEAEKARRVAEVSSNPAPILAIARQMDTVANAAIAQHQLHNAPKGYTRVPNTGRYGALRGLVVRTEIYDDIVGEGGKTGEENTWYDRVVGAAKKGHSIFKWAKVAGNIPSQVRNVVSNMVLLHLSGVPLPLVPVRMVQALHEILTDGKHYRVVMKYGLTEGTFAAQEIFRTNREARDFLLRTSGGKGFNTKTAWNFLRKHGGTIMDVTGDIYQSFETISKTAKVIDEMSRNKKSESDASMAAQKALFDYSQVTPLVRKLRSMPLGSPFITFTLKVAPVIAENLTSVRGLIRLAPYAAIPLVLSAWLKEANDLDDLDDEEFKKLKKAFPDYLQKAGHAYILPYKDENGKFQVLDFGYYFPWVIHENLAAGIWGLVDGDIKDGDFTAFRDAAIAAVGFGGPVPSIISALETNTDSFTGEEIVNEADTPKDQLISMLTFAWDLMGPGTFTSKGVVAKSIQAATGAKDKFGDPKITGGQAVARWFGANVYSIDPERTRAQNIRGMQYELRDLKARLKEKLRDPNVTTEEQKEIRQSYSVLIFDHVSKMRTYLEESEINDRLKVKRVAPD